MMERSARTYKKRSGDGATVPEVVETVTLVMIEAGVLTYKTGGLEAIEAAEDEAAKLAG